VGGFHRAHQALYLDDLLHVTGSLAWGYCGVGLLAQDAAMRDVMREQDCLYTVVERSQAGERYVVVGSIIDYLFAPAQREAVLKSIAGPDCRIVSLTITEGGYYRNDTTDDFNEKHPDIVHDLAHPGAPRCFLGYLAEALDRRRRSGLGPFTVLSCDNLQHNGDVARRSLLAFAERRDPALHCWIARHVAFPNCMVDRIVPATTHAHRDLVAGRLGVDDAWPVVTEPFRQWVIEDSFCAGRPPWELVGVQLTGDVGPYEKAKMRLLNGAHQALCYAGMLMGYEYANDASEDPSLLGLVRTMMCEVTPLLDTPPGIALETYKPALLERLGNPAIRDRLDRIGTDGSARMPKFVLPSLVEALRRGGRMEALCFVVATWFHYLAGRDDDGRPLTVADTMQALLQAAARDPRPGAEALFELDDLIDGELMRSGECRRRIVATLHRLREQGCRATLEEFLAAQAEAA
jgi:mannitol 2-dehydrogenase